MKRRFSKIAIVVAFAALLLVTVVFWLNREPVHQGRPLSEWVSETRSRDPAVKKAALAALQAMDEQAVTHLAGSLNRDETVLERINRTIGDKIPRRFKQMASGLLDVQRTVDRKREAVHALKMMGTNAQEAVPALGRLLRDPNVLLSSLAGTALAEMGPAAVPELISALDEGDYNVRANACSALGKLRTNALPAAPHLASILWTDTGPILGSASYALSRIGQGALPALEPAFKHTNWVTRRWAAYAVGFMVPGPVDAASSLYPLTRDPHPQVRLVAVQSLSRMHLSSPDGIAVLRERFGDPDPAVREAAIQGFANSPWMVLRHMEACIDLLRDPSPQVRGYAAQALMNVSPVSKPAVPELEKLARDEHPFVREKALLALKSLNGPEGSKAGQEGDGD